MSQPPTSLPAPIKELMRATVSWEAFLGFDGHAEPSYAAPVTKSCFRESHSMLQTGVEGVRQAEITTDDPDFDLYFDGDDADVRGFTLYDRFVLGVTATTNATTLQPSAINTVIGPTGTYPWLIVVSF